MTIASKYNPTVAWRTLAANVYQLTRETVTDAATYRITVSAIDTNQQGAGQKEIGYYFVDYIGTPYLIIATASTSIDVQDDFRTGLCPTSGRMGVVYKSVYNGRAQYLAPSNFQHLHTQALANSHRFDMAVIWANDPNAKKVPFTDEAEPGISTYQDDQTDPEDPTKTINYKEDFGDTPFVRLIITVDSTSKYHTMQNALFTYDGELLQSLKWEIGYTTTGYIIISKA